MISATRATLLMLVTPALLTACFQNPAPATPDPAERTASVPAPTPTRSEPLSPLGTVDIKFSGLTGNGADMQVSATAGRLQAAALNNQGSIQFKALSNGTFTTGTRGVDGMRYLYATFLVRNADSAGTAYTTVRKNLTWVAISDAGTVTNTPYSQILKFDGTPAASSVATTILPTTGLQFDRATEKPGLLPGAQDLQVYAENEVAPLVTGGITRAFPFGFVVRNRTVTANRDLAASPAADQYDGIVTVALKLPLQANVADDPFTFNMKFAVVDDSVTRVTESVEEQTLGGAAARAAALGTPQVALLCGSALSGSALSGANALFVGSATTAGAAGSDRLAHIGGDVALKSLPVAYSAVGNAKLSVPLNTGLGQFYSAYPTNPGGAAATLAFTGNSTSRGGSLNVAGDGSFTFTSKAGDGSPAVTDNLNYTVSDGRGCTSPAQTSPVNVNGRIWFARDNAPAGGDGRQDTPFNTLSALQTAAQNGETMYLYRGSGSISGGLTLKPSQTLIGEGAALTYNATNILPAGANPAVINNAGGAGITLSTGNTLRGLSVTGTTAGLTGSSFGTLSADLTTVQASAGTALNLNTGTLNATIKTVNATATAATTHGVNLVGVGGTLSVTGTGTANSGGTVQATGATSYGYNVQPGAANLTLNLTRVQVQNSVAGLRFGTLTSDTGRLTLNVQNGTFTNNGTSIQLNPGNTTNNDYTINNSTFSHAGGGGGIVFNPTNPRSPAVIDSGRITNNTLSMSNSGGGNAITLDQVGPGSARFSVTGNTVTSFGTYGLAVSAQGASAGRIDVTMSGNTISSSAPADMTLAGFDGVYVLSGASLNENATVCLNATGNNVKAVTGTSNTAGFALRKRSGNTFYLQGITDTSDTGVVTFIQNNNLPSTARIRTPPLAPTNLTCEVPAAPPVN